MQADLLTTDQFDGDVQSSQVDPDPEWPSILEAFQALDGYRHSWLTVLAGERQLSVGGGREGYVLVAEAESVILRGVHAERPGPQHLELWIKGSRRDCDAMHLHTAEEALHALTAFALAGQFTGEIHWSSTP